MEEILGLAEFAEHRGALDARLERGRRGVWTKSLAMKRQETRGRG
jgi:hypothetical protein